MYYDQTDLLRCDPEKLVDLKDVRIDTALPVRQRMEQFVQQIGNPYLFKADGLVIQATYLPHVCRRLSDALPGLLIP